MLFTDHNDTVQVRTAVVAGVTAYVVAGPAPARVKSVLNAALARFEHEEMMRHELAEARTQLADREALDRAKGLLMQLHQIAESEACARIRKAAMDKGLKMADIAQRILDAADLLIWRTGATRPRASAAASCKPWTKQPAIAAVAIAPCCAQRDQSRFLASAGLDLAPESRSS